MVGSDGFYINKIQENKMYRCEAYPPNGTMHFKKSKQFLEYKILLLLRDNLLVKI
jgi:hypothetical protein